jgi:arylsulfatase A-like enzyme
VPSVAGQVSPSTLCHQKQIGIDDEYLCEKPRAYSEFVGRCNPGLSRLCRNAVRARSAAEARSEIQRVIGQTYKDSTPDKIPLVKAPAGAPNVILILIDDSGFGQWGTFGGQVPTPNLDRLAHDGISYTQFHTTALCSPTRAALLTGRNHHSAATGVITEIGSGYPGYSGQIPKSEAMGAEILRQSGYSTAFFGKNHNIPDWETSISGPFDRWPGLQGFDHFYGFIGGEANQWQPALYSGTEPVEMEVPKGREKDYTLNENLADKAIEYIHQEKSVTPDRPFFIY